jgi:alkylhydroperoxidase/carboxymuconolactone decarboxylase family protein YurZ
MTKDVFKFIDELADNRRDMEVELRRESWLYAQHVENLRAIYGGRSKRSGGLDATTRILIALGNAVLAGSDSAIEFTITRALNHGATEAKIKDTIEVALLNGGGMATSRVRFAFEVLSHRLRVPRRSKP